MSKIKHATEKYVSDNKPEPLAYKEKVCILDKDLSGYTLTEDGDFKIEAEELSGVEGGTPVVVEINDNGTVHTGNGFFYKDMGFVDVDYNSVDIGDYFSPAFFDGKLLLVGGDAETIPDGVTLKIYTEIVRKTIDKGFIPPNDVPYVYSDGSKALSELKSGAYVLHGEFTTAPGSTNLISSFIDNPTLCRVINDGTECSLLWFEDGGIGNDIRLGQIRIRIAKGTILDDNTYTVLTKELSLVPIISDDNEDYDNEPICGVAVKNYLNDKCFSHINMIADDESTIFTVKIGADGTFKATPWQ